MTALLCFSIAGQAFGGSTSSVHWASSAMTATPCAEISVLEHIQISLLEDIIDNSLLNARPQHSSAIDVSLSSNYSTDIPHQCAENSSHVNTAQSPDMLSTLFNTTA